METPLKTVPATLYTFAFLGRTIAWYVIQGQRTRIPVVIEDGKPMLLDTVDRQIEFCWNIVAMLMARNAGAEALYEENPNVSSQYIVSPSGESEKAPEVTVAGYTWYDSLFGKTVDINLHLRMMTTGMYAFTRFNARFQPR